MYDRGDVVIIKDFQCLQEKYGIDINGNFKTTPRFSIELSHLCGKQVAIIQKHEADCGVSYEASDGVYRYEISGEAISDGKTRWVTKDFLKNGMIVEHKNGNRFFIFRNGMAGINGYVKLSEYRETLTHLTLSEMDVVKVYEVPKSRDSIENLLMRDEKPIAERKEVKRISRDVAYQILENTYGCDVEIV